MAEGKEIGVNNQSLSNMKKIYVRHEPLQDKVQITFHYQDQELSVNREFNFCRKLSECIDVALSRIRTNVSNELTKDSKKKIKKSKKKKTPENVVDQEAAAAKIPVEFRRGEETLTNITFAELISDPEQDQLQFQLLDTVYKVVFNQPWVVNLSLPTTAMAGFIICPSKLELKFADVSCCRAIWSKAKLFSNTEPLPGTDWIYCDNNLLYESSIDDVGYHLKLALTPCNSKGEEGPTVERIMKSELGAGPHPCPYQERALLYTSEPLLEVDEFRIVSYNLLADLYADSCYSRTHLFPYCPSYAFSFDYRKQLILQELNLYRADIICLQEVDLKLFYAELQFLLGNSTQQLIGLMAEKKKCGEGVCTFYNQRKFELIESHCLNIGENIDTMPIFQTIYEQIRHNTNLIERITARSTTLQVIVLKLREEMDTNRYLLVANTHLYFHPDADHIRLLQMGFAMLYVEDVYQHLKRDLLKANDSLSIVFCGDFNSTPDAGIYRLMTEGFVPSNIADWSSNADEAVKNLALQQPFEFRSAYGTPEFTNFTPSFSGCLDYIYYQSDQLTLLQVAPLPTIEQLSANVAIPSIVFPSDHVSLVADFQFSPK